MDNDGGELLVYRNNTGYRILLSISTILQTDLTECLLYHRFYRRIGWPNMYFSEW
jgi:hypothetical protein